MKKIILMLTVVVAIAVNTSKAQVTYKENLVDYSIVNAATVNTVFTLANHQPATQDVKVVLHKSAGSQTNVAVKLQGSKFGDTWTDIGAVVNWKLTTADTTIVISNTTPNRYRSYRTNIVGTGTGTSTVTAQYLKAYLE